MHLRVFKHEKVGLEDGALLYTHLMQSPVPQPPDIILGLTHGYGKTLPFTLKLMTCYGVPRYGSLFVIQENEGRSQDYSR